MKGKGIAALILAAGKPGKKGMEEEGMDEDGPESSEKGDMGEAKQAAAEEAMAALKSNDAKAFADALESFIECCGDY